MTAHFIYPPRGNFSVLNNNQAINIFDDLIVQYETPFAFLNLTCFCLNSQTNDGSYSVWNVPSLPGTGIYNFGAIKSQDTQFVRFPTACSFKLAKFGDDGSAAGGDPFSVTSDASHSTTFSPAPSGTRTTTTTNASLETGSTASSPPIGSASSTTAGSARSVASSSAATVAGMSPATSSQPSSGFDPQSSSTSSTELTSTTATSSALITSHPNPDIGLKAGIAVGATVAAVAIIGLLLVIFRMRRRGYSGNLGTVVVHEKPGDTMDRSHQVWPQKFELATTGYHEMDGISDRTYELSDDYKH